MACHRAAVPDSSLSPLGRQPKEESPPRLGRVEADRSRPPPSSRRCIRPHRTGSSAPRSPPGALMMSASGCPWRSCQAACAAKASAFCLNHCACRALATALLSAASATADTLMSKAFAPSSTSASSVKDVLRLIVDTMIKCSESIPQNHTAISAIPSSSPVLRHTSLPPPPKYPSSFFLTIDPGTSESIRRPWRSELLALKA